MGRVTTFAFALGSVIGGSAMALPSFASGSAYEPSRTASHNGAHRSHERSKRILAAHNRERARLGLPRLRWSRTLEQEAANWGRHLSRQGRLQHASRSARRDTGENLWMGTAGAWDVETMVGGFIEERRHYRHARFPDISRTGNWADVGHYTQVIWRDTQEVGCAVVTERGWDVLVCRYWPAGNVWGRHAY